MGSGTDVELRWDLTSKPRVKTLIFPMWGLM